MTPPGMLNTALGVIVQLAVFVWIVGLGISFIIKEQKKYLDGSKKYIGGFIKKHWRYIIVFILGYLAAYPGTLRFTFY